VRRLAALALVLGGAAVVGAAPAPAHADAPAGARPAASQPAPASPPAAWPAARLAVQVVAAPSVRPAGSIDLALRALSEDARPRYRPVRPFVELVAYQGFLVASGWLYGHSPLKWDPPTWKRWTTNITERPVFPDGDGWWLNWSHAAFGSDQYLMARNSGWSWWSSALFANFGSLLWEYVTEGLFERPSLIDLVTTPILGSLLGEARYRLYQEVKRRAGARWFGRIALAILDPTTSFFELCGW
jgi:hypothetical protein